MREKTRGQDRSRNLCIGWRLADHFGRHIHVWGHRHLGSETFVRIHDDRLNTARDDFFDGTDVEQERLFPEWMVEPAAIHGMQEHAGAQLIGRNRLRHVIALLGHDT